MMVAIIVSETIVLLDPHEACMLSFFSPFGSNYYMLVLLGSLQCSDLLLG